MARVRVCPTCGAENVLAMIRCTQCGVSIAAVSPTEAVSPIPESPATGASCPNCEAMLPSNRAACPYCGESLRAGPCITMEWPWGARLLDGELILGRDPDASPLAGQVQGYDNLSRRHARLCPAAEGLWVEDLGSTNGTFVNETRLIPYQPFLLAESGRLRLAKDFVATVIIMK
ncbi:MAG: FHA domain-containing protein [Candidatus Competibacteraceae bacterium]|nr:MAG: FHA domain-containing protein [Candidatus Competibacteraceae bacterium]